MSKLPSLSFETGNSGRRRIVDSLRSAIVMGKIQPGERLPTRSELCESLSAGSDAVQFALSQLADEGFVHARRKAGTFVSQNPPHLSRYALVFPSRLDGVQYWTDWWTTLQQAAATFVRSEPQKEITSVYDITGHADVEDYQRLLADIHYRRLAGIILLSPPHLLHNTPLVDDCPVPRVYIGGYDAALKIHSVAPNFDSFVERALAFAAGQSRRRPMLVGPFLETKSLWQTWSEACIRHGMEPARRQILSLPLKSNEAPRHLTQTLMLLPPEHRPDTLVIAEDHFVEEVTAGLIASNLPERELPTVIAQTNFPELPRTLVPVTFLGYDSVTVIRKCVDVLDMQRRGEVPPPTTQISAIFASEHVATDRDHQARLHNSSFARAGEINGSI